MKRINISQGCVLIHPPCVCSAKKNNEEAGLCFTFLFFYMSECFQSPVYIKHLIEYKSAVHVPVLVFAVEGWAAGAELMVTVLLCRIPLKKKKNRLKST